MPSRKRRQVDCDEHGPSPGCMICQHLRDGRGLGYWRVEVPPGQDDYETALCEACDELLDEEDGWTDRLFDFAEWELHCRKCFEKTLTKHRLVGVGRLVPEDE